MGDHFSLSELVVSILAKRYGVDNSPPQHILERLGVMVTRMLAIRKLMGGHAIHTQSAYRCEELEKIVCFKQYRDWCNTRGSVDDDEAWQEFVKGKPHPQGLAIDFTCDGFGTPKEIAEFLGNSGLKFKSIRAEDDWVHLTFTSMTSKWKRQLFSAPPMGLRTIDPPPCGISFPCGTNSSTCVSSKQRWY